MLWKSHLKGELVMPRQTQYSRWWAIGGLLTLIFLLASCQSSCGNSNIVKKPSRPTAQQLISQAQDEIQHVKSYHFTLTTLHPGPPSAYSTLINKADGDIQVPDKLQAKANAITLGFTISTQIIAIGNQQYYTNPFTGSWTQTTNLLDPRTITNAHTGVAGILGHLQHPSKPMDNNIDGVPCWGITGQLDASYLSVITGQAMQPGNLLSAVICIGKSDTLPYLISVQGIALQGDQVQTLRTFKLSHFNESLMISTPLR